MQFYSKCGVVTPYCDRFKKLTLLCEGFKPDVPVVSPVVSTPWFPFVESMLFLLPLPDLLLKITLEMLPFCCFLSWYPVVYFRGILLWFPFEVSFHGILLWYPFMVSCCFLSWYPFVVSTMVSSLWCPPPGVMVSTLWCCGVHSVVSWCPPRGVVVSTPWCHGVHHVVLWCPPHGVMVSTPWCCGVHPVVSWCPPHGVVVSTPWCHGVCVVSCLVCGLKLDWKCYPSWCPPCLAWLVAQN